MNKMRGWLAGCGVVAVAALGMMLGAAKAAPKTVLAADIQEGKVEIIGRLGKPLETYMDVGVAEDGGETKWNLYKFDSVDGQKLSEPVRLEMRNVSDSTLVSRTIVPGTHYMLRGYEAAGIVGEPLDPAEQRDPKTAVKAQPRYPFGIWFVVTKIESQTPVDAASQK